MSKEINIGLKGKMRNVTYKDVTVPKSVLGAIIGDIVGSRFEFHNTNRKDFKLFTRACTFTDDTVMTLAVYKALRLCTSCSPLIPSVYISCVKNFMMIMYNKYPDLSYGARFRRWLETSCVMPYYSAGNGAAMRLGAVSICSNLDQAKYVALLTSSISHNHPDAIDGSECVAHLIYTAHNKSLDNIKEIFKRYYPHEYNKPLKEYYVEHKYSELCSDTVPVAITAFLESTSFEDAIRNAISVGGDSDTIAAITGSIAAEYYDIPDEMINKMLEYLPNDLIDIIVK